MEHLVAYYKSKIISNKPASNAALHIVDNSRLSTEVIAPFFQHRMTDTTFDLTNNQVDSIVCQLVSCTRPDTVVISCTLPNKIAWYGKAGRTVISVLCNW